MNGCLYLLFSFIRFVSLLFTNLTRLGIWDLSLFRVFLYLAGPCDSVLLPYLPACLFLDFLRRSITKTLFRCRISRQPTRTPSAL